MKKRGIDLKKKVLLAGVALALTISVVITYISYTSYEQSLIERFTSIAANATALGAAFVNGDRLEDYLATLEKDDDYEDVLSKLNYIKIHSELEYLYVHIPKGDDMFYIFDAQKDDVDYLDISDLGGSDALLGAYDPVYRIYKGESSMETMILDEEYGYLATVLRPVHDSEGRVVAIIGADISMDVVHEELYSYIVQIALIISIIVFVFIILAMVLAQKYVIAPVLNISRRVLDFVGTGDELAFTPLPVHSADELGTLAASINTMAGDVIKYAEDLTKVTADRERIATELSVAAQIQASMLPYIFPAFPNHPQFDIYATMLPAREVGGDFYDFFFVDDDTLAVVIADVSGKGIAAALFMVVAKTLIKNIAQSGKSPKEVFETVNNTLCENNDAGMFVTAFMGYLNIGTGKFVCVNAGHNPPLLYRGETYEWLSMKPCFVLAGMEDMPYVEHTFFLSAKDDLFLYTDGVTEAANNEYELFSEPRLLEVANTYAGVTLPEFARAINREIEIFAEGAEQADDITMLVLRYCERCAASARQTAP